METMSLYKLIVNLASVASRQPNLYIQRCNMTVVKNAKQIIIIIFLKKKETSHCKTIV